ncbi:MAG: metal-dependent hydrolase [Acidobacteriota bacterium]
MPTPIGHALAGAAIAWSAEAIYRSPVRMRGRVSLAVVCAGLAVSPDLDLVSLPMHRMMTHSLVAAMFAGLVVGVVCQRLDRSAAWLPAAICGLAYASHILLDWLGADTKIPEGVQMLWPFSERWFISPWKVFRRTQLKGFFTMPVILSNSVTMVVELLIVGPIALGARALRRRMLKQAMTVPVNAQRSWAPQDPP